MKTIALFCDGTWNSPDMTRATHVHRLFEACGSVDTPEQVVEYFHGVGVPDPDETWGGYLSRTAKRLGGGAFGWGLNQNIKEAYATLCARYAPGDKVMIFGFSRGAYTARSLAGLIRKGGILAEPTPENVEAVFRLYRRRGGENKPDCEEIWQERRRFSPLVATSEDDLAARRREDPRDRSEIVNIAYMGIWDTVGALGIPGVLGKAATVWNQRYRFHDTDLSSLVRSARHAVAIDERRRFYEPALWTNLDRYKDGPGLNNGRTGPDRPYQQAWFVGTHSILGGSAENSAALSAAPLQWIWEGAEREGLRVRRDVRIPDVDPDPLFDTEDIDKVFIGYRATPGLLAWRTGLEREALHPSVLKRIREFRGGRYRPGSLAKWLPELSNGGNDAVSPPAHP
ncbi:DUF2235 domain-containing protein [Sulfitobacter sp. LCG007]